MTTITKQAYFLIEILICYFFDVKHHFFIVFVISVRLTIGAHAFHHDLGLGKLVAEAQLTRHVAERVQIDLKPLCAQARLSIFFVLTPCVDHMPG